eukprot:jgi/Ulvmu1/3335/UM155_0018.1
MDAMSPNKRFQTVSQAALEVSTARWLLHERCLAEPPAAWSYREMQHRHRDAIVARGVESEAGSHMAATQCSRRRGKIQCWRARKMSVVDSARARRVMHVGIGSDAR